MTAWLNRRRARRHEFAAVAAREATSRVLAAVRAVRS